MKALRPWAFAAALSTLSLSTGLALAAPEVHAAPHGDGQAAKGPAAHGGGHADDHHGPGPINWTDVGNKKQPPYIALVVNFALLLFLYYKLGKKPVAEGLKKRREAIAKQIEEAARIKKEAEERAKKYQAQLSRLDEEAAQARDTIKTTGEADKERLLREANEKAARMERDADTLIDAERKDAKRSLYEECVEKAVLRAEELLKSKLTAQDHERLAEEFLAQLGKQAPARAGGAATAAGPMDKRGEP